MLSNVVYRSHVYLKLYWERTKKGILQPEQFPLLLWQLVYRNHIIFYLTSLLLHSH